MMPATQRPWRILADDGQRDPRRNLALEEALARVAGPDPTVRVWRNDRCVVVGRSQVAAAEVDLAACRALGVPVMRRFTGGGTVYHDDGNLNVTLVLRRDEPGLAARPSVTSVPGVYRLLLEPLAAAVASLGVDVEVTERDLLVDGAKVSGVAAWLGRLALLVHGTVLVDADLATLDRVLDGPGAPGDPRWERTRSRRSAVTSLARALGRADTGPARNGLGAAVEAAVVTQVAADTGRPDHPTDDESILAGQLLLSRYQRVEWHLDGA